MGLMQVFLPGLGILKCVLVSLVVLDHCKKVDHILTMLCLNMPKADQIWSAFDFAKITTC